MRTRIVKWGNSLGLRIPRSFAKEVQMSEGSAVDLGLENGHLVIRVVEANSRALEDLLARVTAEESARRSRHRWRRRR